MFLTLFNVYIPSLPHSIEMVDFRYKVFGGTIRTLMVEVSSEYYKKIPSNYDLKAVITSTLKAYFEDCPKTHFEWAFNVLYSLLYDAMKESRMEGVGVSNLFNSRIQMDDEEYKETYPSTFMGLLASNIMQESLGKVLTRLRSLIADRCIGNLAQYNFHGNMIGNRIGEELNVITKDGSILQLQLGTLSTYLIRSMDDLPFLKDGQYGLPVIPNFARMDSIAKVDGNYFIFQSTVYGCRYLSTVSWKKILSTLKTKLSNDKNIYLIWVVGSLNMESFHWSDDKDLMFERVPEGPVFDSAGCPSPSSALTLPCVVIECKMLSENCSLRTLQFYAVSLVPLLFDLFFILFL